MKMNKYQEALSRIERFSNYWNNTERVNNNLEPHFNILQELVDKATPMKPYRNKRYCGNCDVVRLLPEVNYYCSNCGQKIDWGERY